MMSNFDLLDRYFSNSLDKSEMKAFNERLKNDPEFNQEFQEIKEIKLAIKVEARKNIKSLLTDIEDSLNPQSLTTNNQTAMKRMLTVAASLILMVSVSYFVLNGSGQPSPQDVFTENYKAYINLNGQVRGEAFETKSLSSAAYSAYDAGNYSLAVESFEALVEIEKTAENYFYMGISNLEIGDYDAAVKSLNTTLNDFSALKDQSRWYLCMAFLADKKEVEAISVLASLSLNKSSYTLKAKEILNSLAVEITETTAGEAATVITHPEEVDAPDGSTNEPGDRKYQYGEVVEFLTGDVFRFHNETPIKGLREGDVVEFIILKRNNGKKFNGWAFILDKTI